MLFHIYWQKHWHWPWHTDHWIINTRLHIGNNWLWATERRRENWGVVGVRLNAIVEHYVAVTYVWCEQQSNHNTWVHGLRKGTTMQERVRGEGGSSSLRSQPDFDKISTQYHSLSTNHRAVIVFSSNLQSWITMYAFSKVALFGEYLLTFTTRRWQDIHHPLKSACKAAARDKATAREFGCGVHTVEVELIYIQRHVHDFHYSSRMLKTKVTDAEQKNKEVGFGLKLIITMIFH